jgi:hypothetical protein
MVEQQGRTAAVVVPRRGGSREFAAGLEKEELQGKRVLLRRGAKRYSRRSYYIAFMYVVEARRSRRVEGGL